ncbi:alpha/beta hydrolase [Streptomyces sp. NPDC006514]|uniref:alpha/beta fold hydrolase n=1 Tax=Streptomyces sp. NPDC006514 TaxID=3154308 RepID=UPI0033A99F8A
MLLHGLGNNEAIWSGLAPHWRSDVEVHAPRLPWQADGIAAWRHETDSVSCIQEALDAVPGGADLVVAHSFSSVLLLQLLSRRAADADPLDVPGVVLVNPFYKSSADDFHWDVIASTVDDFPRTMAESIRLRTRGRPIDPELLGDMARRLTEWIGPYGWLRFFEAYLRTPLFPVDRIQTPALVFGGGLDRSAPVDHARHLAGLLPRGEELVEPECGHFPMLEMPGRFVGAVHAFLDRVHDRVGPTAAL